PAEISPWQARMFLHASRGGDRLPCRIPMAMVWATRVTTVPRLLIAIRLIPTRTAWAMPAIRTRTTTESATQAAHYRVVLPGRWVADAFLVPVVLTIAPLLRIPIRPTATMTVWAMLATNAPARSEGPLSTARVVHRRLRLTWIAMAMSMPQTSVDCRSA